MRRLDPYPRLPSDPAQRERKLVDLFRDIAETVNALVGEAMPKAVHSAAITADTLIFTGKCVYRGYTITVVTAGGTIDVRDGVAAGGGTIIDTIPVATAAGADKQKTVGRVCETGLYLDFNGATGTVIVDYEV